MNAQYIVLAVTQKKESIIIELMEIVRLRR